MKSFLLAISLILFLITTNCQSRDEVITPAPVTGKWQLTKIMATSMVANQPSTPETPPYQEVFEFKADGTFRRYRSNGYEATGTYSSVSFSTDDQGILAAFADPELTYHELPGFRQYSNTKGQVYLRQTKPDELVESYMASDGYTFFYERVKGNN